MKKKKILFIATRNFYPTDSGDKLHSLGVVKRMSVENDVYLLNFLDSHPYSSPDLEKLNKFCYKVFSYRLPENSIFTTALNTLKGNTWMIAKRSNSFAKRKIIKIIADYGPFEIIIWDHLRATANYVSNDSFNTLFEHNNELKIIKNMRDLNKNILMKTLLHVQVYLMKKYLKAIYNNVQKIVFVSKEDIDAQFINKSTYLEQLILNFEHGSFVDSRSSKTKLLFVGSLDWYPNVNGMKWFIENIYHELEKKQPQFELNIVGRNPSKNFEKLVEKYPKINLYKNVKSVEKFFIESDIFINPIFDGGGINIKILEALSYGIPIISSSFGLRAYIGSQFIPHADNTDQFMFHFEKLKSDYYNELMISELNFYNDYQQKNLLEIQKFLP